MHAHFQFPIQDLRFEQSRLLFLQTITLGNGFSFTKGFTVKVLQFPDETRLT
jgi:hypothetical protein